MGQGQGKIRANGCVLLAIELALTPGDPMNELCLQCPIFNSPVKVL